MTSQCFDPQDLDRIVRLPVDDPRRRHVDDCARCRGLLKAMETFLDPGNTSDLPDLATADAELSARLERAMSGRRRSGLRPRRRQAGLAVAAALALCAVGLATSDFLRLGVTEAPVPGQYERGASSGSEVAMTPHANGIHLNWPEASEAESIVYVFLTAEMSELGRALASGPLIVAEDDPLARAEFCQALAVAQGDTIGRSTITRLSPNPE